MKWAALFILAAATVSQPVEAQRIFRTFSDGDPGTLDPIQSNDPRCFRFTAQLFESPLELAMDAKDHCVLAPGLAALPAVSPDGKTLSFTVIPGVRFADDPCFKDGKGREVVSSDLVYSILRIADPATKSPFFPSFLESRIAGLDAWRDRAIKDKVADYDQPPEGVRAEGSALVLKLADPYPQLLPLLTQPWASVVPREAIARYGSGFGEHPVGTGPFLYAGKDALGNVKMVRNPGYRIKGLPLLDEVRFDVVAEVEKRTDRFLAGDLHVCSVVSQNEDRLMDKKGRFRESLKNLGLRFAEGPALIVSYLTFAMKHQALSKLAVRQAISLALDRKKLNRVVFGDRAIVANSPVPPAFLEFDAVNDKPFSFATQDVKRARKLLSDAGYPEGKGFPELILDMPNASLSPRDEEGTRGMVEDLAAIGIKVQLRSENTDKFNERVRKGDTQLVWTSWYADYADVENFLYMFRSSRDGDLIKNSNYGDYANPAFDKLYDQIAVMYAGPTRTSLVVEAVEILRKDLPWVFLVFVKNAFVVPKSVTGFRYSVLNYSLRDCKIDPPRK